MHDSPIDLHPTTKFKPVMMKVTLLVFCGVCLHTYKCTCEHKEKKNPQSSFNPSTALIPGVIAAAGDLQRQAGECMNMHT